jgi:RNA polymerase sigma-70 factor, ECF subfamily
MSEEPLWRNRCRRDRLIGRPLCEAELVARALRGDASAFEDLVRMYEQLAFRTAYLVTRSASDAEEAAAEAFVKAFRSLDRFRSDRPFRPWLLRIVANEARNRRRATGRREALALRAAAELRSGDFVPSPETETLAEERRKLLLEAVERLQEDQRLVVACRFFLGLGEAETAAVLGVRPGTVKSRLSRALERLREEVALDV